MRNTDAIKAVIAGEFRKLPPQVLDYALVRPTAVPLLQGSSAYARAEVFVRCIFGMPGPTDRRWNAVQDGFIRRRMPYVVRPLGGVHVVIERTTSLSDGPTS